MIDYTGRTAPYGGKELENTMIIDHEYWVFIGHIPNTLTVVGVETTTRLQYDATKQDAISKTEIIPMWGQCSWVDFDMPEANNDK